MKKLLAIARFTASDELHNKSFFVLLGVCVLMVIAIRGCYRGDYMVNGQQMNGLTIAWYVAVGAYHAVAAFGLLAALALSSRALRRDRDNGAVQFMLSRPVSRFEYISGKILGVWLVAFPFMLVLHLTVFVLTLTVSGGTLPMIPVASLVCGINVLFAVCLFSLFSLVLPEFIALVAGLAVVGVSFVSDYAYSVANGQFVQSMLANAQVSKSFDHAALWRIAWPKIGALQSWGSTLIQDKPFVQMGPVHPLVNVVVYTAVIFALLVWQIRREEV